VVLFKSGFTSVSKLSYIHMDDLHSLGTTAQTASSELEMEAEPLFDQDFIKLLTTSLSANRCRECDYAPLICPKCAEMSAEMV